jgi:carbamoyltransferase
MLGAWRLRGDWEHRFRGVVHADGTLRAQIVGDEDTFLAALLRRLWQRYEIAGLINTSFNGPGEPIVHTRADALACAQRLRLDGVVLDGVMRRL